MLPASKAHEKIARRRIQPGGSGTSTSSSLEAGNCAPQEEISSEEILEAGSDGILPDLFSLFTEPQLILVSEYLNLDLGALKDSLSIVVNNFLFQLYHACVDIDEDTDEGGVVSGQPRAVQTIRIIGEHAKSEYRPKSYGEYDADIFDPEVFQSYGSLALVRLFEESLNPFLEDLEALAELKGETLFRLLAIFTPPTLYLLSEAMAENDKENTESHDLEAELSAVRSKIYGYMYPGSSLGSVTGKSENVAPYEGDTAGEQVEPNESDAPMDVIMWQKICADFNKISQESPSTDYSISNTGTETGTDNEKIEPSLVDSGKSQIALSSVTVPFSEESSAPSMISQRSRRHSRKKGVGAGGNSVFLTLKTFLQVVFFFLLLGVLLFFLSSPSFKDEVFRSLGFSVLHDRGKKIQNILSTHNENVETNGQSDSSVTNKSESGNEASLESTGGSTLGIKAYSAGDSTAALLLDPGFKKDSLPEKLLMFIQDKGRKAPSHELVFSGLVFDKETDFGIKDTDDEIFFVARILKLYPNVNLELGQLTGEGSVPTSALGRAAIVRSMLSDLGIQRNRLFLVGAALSENIGDGKDAKVYLRVVSK